MRTGNKFILILSALLVYVTLLAAPQQADAAELKKLVFSTKMVYMETGNSGSLDSIGLRVLAIMDNGLEQDVTEDCTLTSSKNTIFTVSGQTLTAVAKGSAALKAAYGGKTASLSVKVIDKVNQFTLSADNPTLQEGGSLSVKALLEYSDTTLIPLNVTSYCQWTSDDDDIVSVKAGKLKALDLSETGIGIQAECVLLGSSIPAKSITVKVINPIQSLKAEPFSLNGTELETYNDLEIKPVYKDGSSGSDVTSSAQFSSTNIKVVKVGNTDSDKGQVNFLAAGKASIKAAYAGKTVSIPVRVIGSGSVTALTSIPDVTELQIVAGSSSSIKFKDNNNTYVTSYVRLTSDDETIATTAPGKITGLSPGEADIKCTYGGQEKTIRVTVIKKVSSLSVSPTSIDIAADQKAQLVLTATYTDKTTGQVTGAYTSGDANIAVVDTTGAVTGGTEAGSTKITASFGGKTITVPVNVIGSNFSAITFSTSTSGGTTSPADITYNLATGNSLKLYAQALFGGAHSTPVTDITSKCVWTSDDTSVATVSGGTVTAKKAGATRIIATYGNRSNSFTVNVWPTISSITATPSTLGFFGAADAPKSISSIIAKFSDGSEKDLLPSEITWASRDENMVTVSNGTVTLVTTPFKTGSTTVTGTLAGKTFTVAVSVSPEITDFSLSTGSITLITGTAATFNVTAQYTGGTYSDVTKICDYTVKDGSGTVTSKVTVDKDKGTITAQTGAPVSGTIEVTLKSTTKSMNYEVIPKPSALGMELVQAPDTTFDQDNLVATNGTFYFNLANQSETYNLYVHSTAAPTADTSRISGNSLLNVFSSNNSVAKVNWDSGDSTYKLTRVGNDGSSAVITVYFLDKSFKLTVGVDLDAPDPPAEDGSANKEGSTQSGNFNIIVTAEAGSSVSAIVGTDSVLTGTAGYVTATTAGKATLPIDISKLPNEGANNAIVITATDQAGNPSTTLTVNVTKDTTEPVITTVTAAQADGLGDTIAVQFDENIENSSNQVTSKANWTIAYADDDIGTNSATIETTNAAFVYDGALKRLTITLDEATDQAFIPGGKFVKVTPSSTNISDEYGNAGVAAAYTAGTVPANDTTGPAVATGWATTANPNELTITYSEVLSRSAATATANWTLTSAGGLTVSSASLDNSGKTVIITTSGSLVTGDTLAPSASITDLAGNVVSITTYTP